MNVTPRVRLRDVSIQMDVYDGSVAVWAVGTKGDVLYRHGVTKDCPQVNFYFFVIKFRCNQHSMKHGAKKLESNVSGI